MKKETTFHRCTGTYCRGAILKHVKGNQWRCNNCGKTYSIKSTLENFGLMTAGQLHKAKTKQPIGIEDLTKSQFNEIVKKWKKKNL